MAGAEVYLRRSVYDANSCQTPPGPRSSMSTPQVRSAGLQVNVVWNGPSGYSKVSRTAAPAWRP